MPTDPDGDSEMASSPASEHDSQPGSRTPTNNISSNNNNDNLPHSRFTGSEFSPPGSQTQQVSETSGANEVGRGTTTTESVNGADRPGASWMNKRAKEEYQQALEYVVDKDFSLREFGDPFDERDMEEELV